MERQGELGGGAPPQLRRLAPADAPAYRALMLDGYAREPDAFTAEPGERAVLPLSFWEARLATAEDSSEMVFGVFDGGRLAGALGLGFMERPKLRHKATLFGMVVAHDARRRGFGRALVLAALAQARAREGILLVQLTVTEGNAAAEALYAACGFVRFGIEPMAVKARQGYLAKIQMWQVLAQV